MSSDPYLRFSTDVCRFRHRSNKESELAHAKAQYSFKKIYQEIIDLLKAVSPEGMTGKELANCMNRHRSTR
jgi:hypothetical protein